MLQDKQYYINIAPLGWQWVGTGNLPYTHTFQSGNYCDGFFVIECSEDCLTNGDLQFLAKNKMTCNHARLKKLSRAIAKRLKTE